MVWLYGGGFYSGSPSLILYDGKALALTGNVVVVNINYRVGPFGYLFFDHPDVPGNMGMLDQVISSTHKRLIKINKNLNIKYLNNNLNKIEIYIFRKYKNFKTIGHK